MQNRRYGNGLDMVVFSYTTLNLGVRNTPLDATKLWYTVSHSLI